MEPTEFLQTLYFGDRGCKCICINGWESRISLHITTISRIRSNSGRWDYYTDEDIEDGLLVFTGVISFEFSPIGLIPNDAIHSVIAEPYDEMSEDNRKVLTKFIVHAESADSEGHHADVLLSIVARGIHLEDPRYPNVIIDQ